MQRRVTAGTAEVHWKQMSTSPSVNTFMTTNDNNESQWNRNKAKLSVMKKCESKINCATNELKKEEKISQAHIPRKQVIRFVVKKCTKTQVATRDK